MKLAKEARFQPVAPQGLQCLKREVHAREQQQSDADHRQKSRQCNQPVTKPGVDCQRQACSQKRREREIEGGRRETKAVASALDHRI